MNSTDIVTGERLQNLASAYFGFKEDFYYNPVIGAQIFKHCSFRNSVSQNPSVLFCYSHRLDEFAEISVKFKNPFVLLTHNSDGNICDSESVRKILQNPLLLMWFGQNCSHSHPKLDILPIGMANSQWPHGNLQLILNTKNRNLPKVSRSVYFNFSIDTNRQVRDACYQKLKNKLPWLDPVSPQENLDRLSTFEYCVCPAGNGLDTHRLWEALYLEVIPIVLRSTHTELLVGKVPLLILESWDDLEIQKLPEYHFPDEVPYLLSMKKITSRIMDSVKKR